MRFHAVEAGAEGALPFVTKGVISLFSYEDGLSLTLLDGFNNPGFSGGPVVFHRMGTGAWQVLGVVGGYLEEAIDVTQPNAQAASEDDVPSDEGDGPPCG